jgi:hypothetical protein
MIYIPRGLILFSLFSIWVVSLLAYKVLKVQKGVAVARKEAAKFLVGGTVISILPLFPEVFPSLVGMLFFFFGAWGLVRGEATISGKSGRNPVTFTGDIGLIVNIILIVLGVVAVPYVCGETWWSPYFGITPLATHSAPPKAVQHSNPLVGVSSQVIFGGVQSHYTTRQVVRWSVTNNGKNDLSFYCIAEMKVHNGWQEVDYAIVGGALSREKVVRQLPLRVGETRWLNWSLSKDADRLEVLQAKAYRLKAKLFDANDPSGNVLAEVYSPEFEVTPTPGAKP